MENLNRIKVVLVVIYLSRTGITDVNYRSLKHNFPHYRSIFTEFFNIFATKLKEFTLYGKSKSNKGCAC